MKVFRLVPLDLTDPDWAASDWTRPVVIRAPTEDVARSAATLAFGKAVSRSPSSASIPINPWRQERLVKVDEIPNHERSAGEVEMLDPPGYNEFVSVLNRSGGL